MKQKSFLFVCVLLITAASFLGPDAPALRAQTLPPDTLPPDTPAVQEPSPHGPPHGPPLSEDVRLPGPVAFTATASESRVDLKWNAVDGADGYEVWKGDGRGRSVRWGSEAYAITTDTFHSDSDVAAYATYSYAVRTVAAGKTEGWSEVESVKIPGEVEAPAAAPSVSVAAAGATAVEVSWSSVAGASGYYLQFWYDGLGDRWSRFPGELQSPYRHSGLTPGVEYFYIVSAVNAAGKGPWSDWETDDSRITLPVPPAATTERDALIALYEAAGGDNWEQKDNWLSDRPLSDWHGVTTDAGGHVTHLKLGGNRLSGTIPDLGALTHLEELALTSNLLTGPVPDLGAFSRLTTLLLSHNRLTGPIPDLGSLSSLEYLYLNSNQLTGPIPDLGAVTSLRTLNLMRNRLSGTIPDLGHLANLRGVSLGYNRLTGSIPDLRALPNLGILNLEHNKLSGPVPDLTGSNLGGLNLTGNPLCAPEGVDFSRGNPHVVYHFRTLTLAPCSGVAPTPTASTQPAPDPAGERAALAALYRATGGDGWKQKDNWLSDRPLSDWHGVTTDAGGHVTRLKLGGNQLNGTLPDLSALTYLEELSLTSNLLTGPVPDLGAFSRLTWLALSHNRLSGPIPDLGSLTSLEVLYLNSNQLTGPIPDLGAVTNLRTLNLMRNRLSGTIPDLNHLPNLGGVSLGYNRLTGPVPDLRALPNLTSLNLEHNQLSGPVPDLTRSNLAGLNLTGNPLCAPAGVNFSRGNPHVVSHFRTLTLAPCSGVAPTAPDPAGERAALAALYRATDGPNWKHNDNWLSGAPIGTWHGVFTDKNGHVTELRLEQNRLRGALPALNALTHLTTLYLYENELTGPIPELKALTNLEYVWLSGNRFSGPVPALNSLPNLSYLNLAGNQLTGPVPDLSAVPYLRQLILRSNRLTGPIPDLSTLIELEILRLDSNQLTGPIPDLSALTKLTFLELDYNRLTGPILNLGRLTRLTSLSLRFNQFTGPAPDLSALTSLTRLDLEGNQLCLPQSPGLSGANQVVTGHLNSLNLPACTGAELALTPDVPRDLTATVDDDRVTLRWSPAANAAAYELRVWDSINREWGGIGGGLRVTSHTHTVLKDGRNYYYQVRARNVNGVRSEWSAQVYAAVVTPRYPPPPPSLGLDMLYQKYLETNGVAVVAPSEVSDVKMAQTREVITGMLSNRPDLLRTMAANNMIIFIESDDIRGIAFKIPGGWEAYVRAYDRQCDNLIHEFAHVIHFALEEQAGGPAFNARLLGLYQSALNAGLWAGRYASTDAVEYWAEAVVYWLWGTSPRGYDVPLAGYDPEIVKLIEEELAGATVPAACKP